MRLYF